MHWPRYLVAVVMLLSACHSEPAYGSLTAHEWIDSLRTASLRGRIRAADALGRILERAPNSPHAVQALIVALDDQEDAVRMAAAAALAAEGVRAPGALRGLHAALHDSAHSEVRVLAASVLGSLASSASPATIAILIEALGDEDPRVRASAARALGKIGPPAARALSKLVDLTRDPEPFVRIEAMESARRIGETPAASLPMLHKALRDSAPEVRTRAAYAIADYGSDAAVLTLDLAERLSDPSPLVRRAAAVALGSIGPAAASAAPALRRTGEDPDPGVRQAVGEALRSVSQ